MASRRSRLARGTGQQKPLALITVQARSCQIVMARLSAGHPGGQGLFVSKLITVVSSRQCDTSTGWPALRRALTRGACPTRPPISGRITPRVTDSARHMILREDLLGSINLGRVILGGFVAGVIINLFEFVLNGVLLANQWTDLMASINRPVLGLNDIIIFNVMGFVMGLVAVWTYAAIRPRFGAGVKTSVYAALLTWITAYVLATGTPYVMGVFTMEMSLTLVLVGLVEIIVATIVGAWLYKEAA